MARIPAFQPPTADERAALRATYGKAIEEAALRATIADIIEREARRQQSEAGWTSATDMADCLHAYSIADAVLEALAKAEPPAPEPILPPARASTPADRLALTKAVEREARDQRADAAKREQRLIRKAVAVMQAADRCVTWSQAAASRREKAFEAHEKAMRDWRTTLEELGHVEPAVSRERRKITLA